ncbi:alpha/beta fold hydrolase [Actinacidiphila paucisporea]|uniref:Pimeloyl-ACP methyl ester carboxylesterase n=1 Tax=Actinacidiphila paucisporea TaxID=310782 RepID=A0A1M7H6U7_9ACTN|nr:alpha/beta hydrolase [Actinacidiphila paucisporea]SHM24118.1 Pimeloyl-ACP methyl ester carboxylesterase [Actinacidiphila paucisporea]
MTNTDRPMPPLDGVVHRWVTVRGARLHLAESGSGEPVVLLHGFPQHWYAWRALVPLLAGDHRLICVDLRGFGWSEQTGRGYDTDGLGDDVIALLDELGLDRVTLVGHNWGAGVGFRLCQRAPERFRAFLALNMAHPWTRHRDVLPHLWRMWFTAFVEYPVVGRLVLRHWPAFTRYLLRRAVADRAVWREADLAEFTEAAQASAHAGQAMFWQYVVRDIPAGFRGVHRRRRPAVPTLVLGGALDPVIPPALLRGGAPEADGLTVRVVPGAGHHLHEERPELVAEALRELIAGAG